MAKMGPVNTLKDVKIDLKPLLEQVAMMSIQRIKERTKKGIDMFGNPFAPYSESYKRQRMNASRSYAVQLVLSGDMLRSLAVEKTEILEQRATAIIGVTANPSTYVDLRSRTQKVQGPVAFEVDKKGYSREVAVRNSRGETSVKGSKRKGKGEPPGDREAANIVGYWLHHGTKDMPARPWCGVSEKEILQIVKDLQALVKPKLK